MKRTVDVTFSVLALLFLSPLLVLVAVLIRFKLGSPVLFRQSRPGLHGKLFDIIKFRTMNDRRDREGNLLDDHDRLNGFGKFLRATSLDEFPELWNVLRGQMSFVGPRPLLAEYLPLYSAKQARRHEVRPGITGWAQINGRNAQSWDERFNLDLWYADHRSLWLDCKILVLTLWNVIARKGISSEGHATMPKFTGS